MYVYFFYRDSCWYAPVALKQSLKFIPVSAHDCIAHTNSTVLSHAFLGKMHIHADKAGVHMHVQYTLLRMREHVHESMNVTQVRF